MNKTNQQYNDWGGYGFLKPVYAWLKKNITTIAACIGLGFICGYNSSQVQIELDCKYAKAVRLNDTAFKCERIL